MSRTFLNEYNENYFDVVGLLLDIDDLKSMLNDPEQVELIDRIQEQVKLLEKLTRGNY